MYERNFSSYLHTKIKWEENLTPTFVLSTSTSKQNKKLFHLDFIYFLNEEFQLAKWELFSYSSPKKGEKRKRTREKKGGKQKKRVFFPCSICKKGYFFYLFFYFLGLLKTYSQVFSKHIKKANVLKTFIGSCACCFSNDEKKSFQEMSKDYRDWTVLVADL